VQCKRDANGRDAVDVILREGVMREAKNVEEDE
jgi:hypothetical protein